MRTLTQKLLGTVVLMGSLLTLGMSPAQAHWGGGGHGAWLGTG